VDILYCGSSSFEHGILIQRKEPVLAFTLLNKIISASDARELPSTVMESLTAIAIEFRQRFDGSGKSIDPSWMTASGLADAIVQSSFYREGPDDRDESEPYHYLDDESLTHPLDAKSMSKGSRSHEEGTSPPEKLTGNSLFGATCLMAVVVETERWNVYDHSEDQLSDLRLGVLQPMAPIFLHRLSEGLDYEIHDRLEELPLNVSDARLLELWARHLISLTK
jgi:hypothetical protein